jgi:hypothetical protein
MFAGERTMKSVRLGTALHPEMVIPQNLIKIEHRPKMLDRQDSHWRLN